jgi:hypothetical protein
MKRKVPEARSASILRQWAHQQVRSLSEDKSRTGFRKGARRYKITQWTNYKKDDVKDFFILHSPLCPTTDTIDIIEFVFLMS